MIHSRVLNACRILVPDTAIHCVAAITVVVKTLPKNPGMTAKATSGINSINGKNAAIGCSEVLGGVRRCGNTTRSLS